MKSINGITELGKQPSGEYSKHMGEVQGSLDEEAQFKWA